MQALLPERLRILRAQEGLTIIEAAKKIGIGRDTLSELERGVRQPVGPTLEKIARAYNVSIEDLMEGEVYPLGEAPLALLTDEERRAKFHGYRQCLDEVYELLESLAESYEQEGNLEKFKALTMLADFAAIGAGDFVMDWVGSPKDLTSRSVYNALERVQALSDDIDETAEILEVEPDPEGIAGVTDISNWRRNKTMAS
jgi:transcriptional regulator with XRE-family HTH domain